LYLSIEKLLRLSLCIQVHVYMTKFILQLALEVSDKRNLDPENTDKSQCKEMSCSKTLPISRKKVATTIFNQS